jgi:glycosyltransferase involved in cell wall biosynthesis
VRLQHSAPETPTDLNRGVQHSGSGKDLHTRYKLQPLRRPGTSASRESASRAAGAAAASDAIGYGVTSSSALVAAMSEQGCTVEVLDVLNEAGPTQCTSDQMDRATWTSLMLLHLVDRVRQFRPDVIFIFHSFVMPASLIRRLLMEADLLVPLVGYLHGSHWDRTDLFRSQRYPNLQWLDLANIAALDLAFVVSRAFLAQLRRDLSGLPPAALQLNLEFLPLPIATSAMDDAIHADKPHEDRQRVLFNHAPIESKHPEIFARVMDRIMANHDVDVVFTRRITAQDHGYNEVRRLTNRYPSRVILGNDLSQTEYYRLLGRCGYQASTATHETLGVATLESMYANCCCALPDLPAYREITGNCAEAIYPPGEAGLHSALIRSLTDAVYAERVRARLRTAADRYRPVIVAQRLMSLLEAFLQRGR